MNWHDFSVQAAQWWHSWHFWVVTFIILIAGWISAGAVVKKKKMNKAQAFFMPLFLGLIYFLGSSTHVSRWEWIWSALIMAFGLWRLYVALQPKTWNASAEAVSGKETNKAGIHWSGLFGCLIFHTSLVWIIWSGSTRALILGVLGTGIGYLLSCLYNPNLRQRWVIFVFRKPRYALPDIEEIGDEDEAEARYEALVRGDMGLQESRWWNLLLRGKRWMDEGLNLILIPSWFPSFDIGILQCEKLEINGPKETGLETPWLPTRPELIESEEDRDPKTLDIREGTKTAGPPVRLTFKLTGVRHDPRPFLRLSDEDREDDTKFQGLIGRYCQAALAWYTRQLMADEAVVGNSYESDIDDPDNDIDNSKKKSINAKRRASIMQQLRRELKASVEAQVEAAIVVATTEALAAGRTLDANEKENVKKSIPLWEKERFEAELLRLLDELYEPIVLRRNDKEYKNLFGYIAEELRRHTGLRLISFEILDIDPSPEVEAAQKAKKTAQIAVETEKLKRKARAIAGAAEGDFIARQIDAVAEAAKVSPDIAMAKLTALRLAESGSNTIIPTSILDALGRLFGGRE